MSSTAEEGGGVEAALAAFAKGTHVVVLAGGEKSGEGASCSLVLAAESASAEKVAFMIRQSTGILSAAATDPERFEGFRLSSVAGAASVDFLPGSVSGTSAKERATTLRALCDTSHSPASFRSPGHIALLNAAKGGVLETPGVVEAACDLCRMAGQGIVALAELMREDGEAYTPQDAKKISQELGLAIVSVAELQAHRRRQEAPPPPPPPFAGSPMLQSESKIWIDDVEADCAIRVYSTANPKIEVVTVVKGNLQGKEGVPARVHSECFTGDILASKRCDCGQQLHKFLRIMNAESCGVLIYVRGHEGRGIGLSNKIKAYHLQDEGLDTVDANLHLGLPVDTRTYEDSLFVLRHLGVKSIRLYTNNPEKISSLEAIVKEVVALASVPCSRNEGYLKTKRDRCNHRTVLGTFKLPTLSVDTSGVKVGIVYTSWNKYYVDELLKAALAKLEEAGVKSSKLVVSGATELISGARAMIRHGKPDAIIVLGVLIRGNSDLYDATCTAVMNGLMELNASQDTPIVSGVLMCQNEEQADERSRGASNPASAWAETALHMSTLASQLTAN